MLQIIVILLGCFAQNKMENLDNFVSYLALEQDCGSGSECFDTIRVCISNQDSKIYYMYLYFLH